MSYPPQQPENGWSDQQEPVDPFAPGNAVPPADAYGQQPQQPGQPPAYQAQPPVYYPEQQQGFPPPSDQTQALPLRGPQDPNAPQYYQPADPNAEIPTDPNQQQYQPQADPNAQFQPSADPNAYPQPVDPNAYPQQVDPNAYQQPVDPNAQFRQPVDPNAQFQQPVDPNAFQQGYQQPGYPQAQPLPDPFAPQAPEQPFPQAPVSASPTSAQPYSAQPASGQPYAETPPGVPESPFAGNLPTPVSASPTSGQPWGNAPATPIFQPRKPKRGLPGWAYVVGVIVIVAALAVGGVVWLGSGTGTGDDPASASPSATKSKEPKEDKATLVTDSKSKLAFASLPAPWETLDEEHELPGAESLTGQVLDADKGVSGFFGVGELDVKKLKYADSDVVDAGKTWAQLIDESQWVDSKGKQLKGVERKAPPKFYNFRVDGHKAYYMTYQVTWKSDKVAEKGATVTIGVIDKGGKAAAGFLAILPDSLVDKHKPAIKDTMLTMRFED